MSDDLDGRQLGFIITFDVLNFLALIILSAVFLTARFSPRIRRVPTWYLYILAWDIYSLSYLLIIGRQTGPGPVRGWCLFQSAMIYATPVLVAAAILVFVTQIYIDIRFALGLLVPSGENVKRLLIVPWVLFTTVICVVLVIGLTYPNSVNRSPSGMFCRLDVPFPSQLTSVMVMLSIVLAIIIGASIATTVHRHREPWQALIGSKEFQSYDFVFRLTVFFLAPVIAIGLIVIKFFPSNKTFTAEVNIIYAILPASAGIVSSSQKDIWYVWLFWRSPPVNCALTEEDERQCKFTSNESLATELSSIV